jgi:hypothetical protein
MARVTLRRGRIIGIEAGGSEGFFSTRDLIFAGRRLEINAEPTAKDAYLRVELLSVEGRRGCPGFEFDGCDHITRDDLHSTVTWKSNADVGEWEDKPIRVRFRFRSMRVYDFQFTA